MIFVDSGAFLGRYLEDDQYYPLAIPIWEALAHSREPLVTSSFVLDETFTGLARKADYRFAADKAKRIYDSHLFLILRPSEEHERKALDFFEKYADQKVSFTDCISFVLMREHRISRVFTFDRHFRLAGFETVPERV